MMGMTDHGAIIQFGQNLTRRNQYYDGSFKSDA